MATACDVLGGPAVADVTASIAPADVRLWVSLDVHNFSIGAATLPPAGGTPQVSRIETTERAIRRFIDRLGGPQGLAVCCEAGPGGFALWRLLTRIGVACDVVAPSLVAVRAGDRVKTDRRDAKKLVALHRAGLLRYVHPPTAETEGLRDLLRCRDDLRCARTAARQRVLKQLLRHGRIFRDGKTSFSLKHRRWINAQRLDDPFAQLALEQLLIHLDGIERQLDALDAGLEQIAQSERWGEQVKILTRLPRHLDLDGVGVDLRDRRLRALRSPARADALQRGSGKPAVLARQVGRGERRRRPLRALSSRCAADQQG